MEQVVATSVFSNWKLLNIFIRKCDLLRKNLEPKFIGYICIWCHIIHGGNIQQILILKIYIHLVHFAAHRKFRDNFNRGKKNLKGLLCWRRNTTKLSFVTLQEGKVIVSLQKFDVSITTKIYILRDLRSNLSVFLEICI